MRQVCFRIVFVHAVSCLKIKECIKRFYFVTCDKREWDFNDATRFGDFSSLQSCYTRVLGWEWHLLPILLNSFPFTTIIIKAHSKLFQSKYLKCVDCSKMTVIHWQMLTFSSHNSQVHTEEQQWWRTEFIRMCRPAVTADGTMKEAKNKNHQQKIFLCIFLLFENGRGQ